MPPTTYSTIKIGQISGLWNSFSGTPVDLLDGTKYQLAGDGWAPGVARYNPTALGGYEPVTETFTVNIIGATRQEVFDNLEALTNVLDTARRYSAGLRLVTDQMAIGIAVQPIGSNLSGPCWDTVIDGEVDLPSDYLDQLLNNAIDGVRVTIRRLGVWLIDAETLNAGTATNIANTFSHSWAAAPPEHSRLAQIYWGPIYRDQSGGFKLGTLIVTPQGSSPLFYGGSGAASANITTAANANSKTGTIVKLQPSGAATSWVRYATSISTWRRVAVFASFKNIVGSPPMTLQFLSANNVVLRTIRFTPLTGKVMCIGTFDVNQGFDRVQLNVDSISNATSIEMDYLCFVNLDSRHTRIVELGEDFLSGDSTTLRTDPYNVYVRYDTLLNPQVLLNADVFGGASVNAIYAVPAFGDLIFTSQQTMGYTILAQGSGSNWRPVTNGGAVQAPQFSIKLFHGRLILE
jgi:hypothetical protein